MPRSPIQRSRLHADPRGIFLHDAVLAACNNFPRKTAIVDTSCPDQPRRISYAEYGDLVQRVARNFVALGVRPCEVIAIYLPNCWEYAVAYHAATLAGAIPTLVNPSYRDREVQYQLKDSGAVLLITDGASLVGINAAGIN